MNIVYLMFITISNTILHLIHISQLSQL